MSVTARPAPPRAVGPADLALVAVGGALGGPARYAVETALPALEGRVPWGTLTVNLVGALLLGVLVGADGWGRRRVVLLAGTGFLGAFTTFSTWVVELGGLARDGHLAIATGYLAGTLVVGLLAAAAGLALGRRLVRHEPPVGRASGSAAGSDSQPGSR